MNQLIDLGIITSTKGLKGEVKVKPLSEKQLLMSQSTFHLSPPTPLLKTLTVQYINQNNKQLILKFEEINSIEEASSLKGKYLQQTSDNLPGDYFAESTIIGSKVFTNDGKLLGTVKSLEESKAHDILVVGDKVEHRIPIVKELIKEINPMEHKIVLKVLEDEIT